MAFCHFQVPPDMAAIFFLARCSHGVLVWFAWCSHGVLVWFAEHYKFPLAFDFHTIYNESDISQLISHNLARSTMSGSLSTLNLTVRRVWFEVEFM